MLLLSEKDILSLVDMRDMMEAVKTAFRMKEEGGVDSPLRTVIGGQEGTFLFMPSYAPALDAAAVKVVDIFPKNAERGLVTSPAQVLLMDGSTGYALALLDGACITRLRTGAATGAAFDLLARKDCRKGALFGTGGMAAAQLEAMLTARALKEVCIYSPNRAHLLAFTERMQRELARFGAVLSAAEDPADCVRDADLIVTATTSAEPVFDGTLVKPGATVSCVGTFQPEKHELDPALLPRAGKIFCDSKEAVLSESGDLLIPLGSGLITEADITGSLGDVVRGLLPGREHEEEIIVFESVGIAVQDLVAAKVIYDRALEKGGGLRWPSE